MIYEFPVTVLYLPFVPTSCTCADVAFGMLVPTTVPCPDHGPLDIAARAVLDLLYMRYGVKFVVSHPPPEART